ncbi:MAG: carbohydrate kinase [Candidatus Neomarinimicrobiota bacterium]|nr:MAG: carbohydrate kinase [Candidatus Neomarinimicrobiota bacterium]
MKKEILCVGEILWDSLPDGLFLGGAPFNVAYQLSSLGEKVAIASKIGNDNLGERVIQILKDKKIASDLIQVDSSVPTGIVNVSLDHSGSANYEFMNTSAWDYLELTEDLKKRALYSRAMVFGTLAQRNIKTRKTIMSLCELSSFKILDINLRPPFENKEIVENSLYFADLLKLNTHELAKLGSWFDLGSKTTDITENIIKKYNTKIICITRGANGAILWIGGKWYEHPGYRVNVVDTVGSGDAFLAALISGLFLERKVSEVLEFANSVGAYVATKNGATPKLNFEMIRKIIFPTR